MEEMDEDSKYGEVEAMNQRECLSLVRIPEMCSPLLDRFGVAIRSVSDHSTVSASEETSQHHQHLTIILAGFF
jgi:hypothetical protein